MTKRKPTVICGLTTGLLLLAAGTPNSKAAAVFTATESGSDVLTTLTGSLDLAAWILLGSGGAEGFIQPDLPAFSIGPSVTSGQDRYRSASNYSTSPGAFPGAFGSGGLTLTSGGSGDSFFFNGGSVTITVPAGYVFEDPLSSSRTITNHSLTSLGMTPGSYIYSWGSGATADSLTVNVVIPESSQALLFIVGLAAIGLRRRRG